MSNLGRFALMNMAGNAFVPLSGAVTAPLLASALGVTGRGEVAAATTPLLLALTVAGLGLPEAATYFVARSHHSRRNMGALWIGLATGSTLGLLGIWLARDFLAGGDEALASTILMCSLFLPVCLAGGLLRGMAAGQHLWVIVNLERFLTALLRLLAILFLITTSNLNVVSASLAIVGSQALGIIVYVYLAVRKKTSRDLADDAQPVTEVYRFAAGAWFGSLAGVLLLRFDQLLMLPLSNSYQLGVYAVAVNIAELMLIGSNAVRDVVFSAESAKPDPKRMLFASRIALYGTIALSVISFCLCLAFLPALFGSEFGPATMLFGVMAIGFSLGAPGSIAGSGLASRGVPHLRSISLSIAAVTNVALVVLLVPTFGAFGAAIATAVCAALGGLLNQIFYARRYDAPVVSAYYITSSDIAALLGRLKRRVRTHELSK